MSIRIYFLDTDIVQGTSVVRGIQYIHNAVLDVEGTLYKLIQNTTDAEHISLSKLAESWRESSDKEIKQFKDTPNIHDIPESVRDLAKEIDELKTKVAILEAKE